MNVLPLSWFGTSNRIVDVEPPFDSQDPAPQPPKPLVTPSGRTLRCQRRARRGEQRRGVGRGGRVDFRSHGEPLLQARWVVLDVWVCRGWGEEDQDSLEINRILILSIYTNWSRAKWRLKGCQSFANSWLQPPVLMPWCIQLGAMTSSMASINNARRSFHLHPRVQ